MTTPPGKPTQKSIYEISKSFFDEETYPNSSYRKPSNSYKLLMWIGKYSTLRSYDRLVALQVASYYNKKLGYCYPTYAQLSEKLGISVSTVMRAVQAMKLSGEWIIVNVPVKGSKKKTVSNRYYPLSPLTLEQLDCMGVRFPDRTNERFEWVSHAKQDSLEKHKKFVDNLNIKKSWSAEHYEPPTDALGSV